MGQFDTIKIILKAKAQSTNQIDRYNHIENEFDQFERFVMPKAPRKIRDAQLYKFLHLTRASDTSLRLIVDALHITGYECHMKSYLKHLTSKGLHYSDMDKFISNVVHTRNMYVHVADKYITKQELIKIVPVISEMLQKALICK